MRTPPGEASTTDSRIFGRRRKARPVGLRGQLVGPPGSAPIILVFFDKTPRYTPLDDSESAGVMP